MRVVITEIKRSGNESSVYFPRTNHADEAVRRAVRRHTGRTRAEFFRGSFRPGVYGTAYVWSPGGGAYSAVTGSLRIDIDA